MFSEAKAHRVTQFIECLRHTKGEFHGQPFKLLPWQEKVIRDVFGTMRDDYPTSASTRPHTSKSQKRMEKANSALPLP